MTYITNYKIYLLLFLCHVHPIELNTCIDLSLFNRIIRFSEYCINFISSLQWEIKYTVRRCQYMTRCNQ